MDGISTHKDINHYRQAKRSNTSPKSNLCSRYLVDKERFCGNYCTRKELGEYHDRCWKHIRYRTTAGTLGRLRIRKVDNRPRVVIVMITSNGTIYNKSKWINFLIQCEENDLPISLIIYADFMFKTTVRHPFNFISRFRPIPNMYRGKGDISLINAHGGLRYTTVVMDMLEYACRVDNAKTCFLITERTIPIRSARTVYRTAISYGDKCVVDPSFNVRFSSEIIPTLPSHRRNKEFSLVNFRGQGLLSVKFLKEALPSLPVYCNRFGIKWNDVERIYEVANENLFEHWKEYVSAFPDEFWLLNSFLFYIAETKLYPIKELQTDYLANMPKNDRVIITEIAEYRDNVKRSVIFKSENDVYKIKVADEGVTYYYKEMKGVNEARGYITTHLRRVIRFLRKHKRVLFFRSVEL